MARDAVESAAQQALRAGQIIRRLREFVARGESDRQTEDLRRLVDEASALALVGAKEAGVMSPSISTRCSLVLVDKVQVQQVLLNLIATPWRRCRTAPARIDAFDAPGDRETVEIDVRDTGPGIAPEILPKLFQPFVTTKPHGMGVGFPSRAPLSNPMAANFGPTRSRAAAPFSISPCSIADEEGLEDVSNAVVHLIDDDEDVRRSVSFLLSTAGFAVRVYELGVKFLEKLEGLPPGCIVSDVRMPGMDGVELQRQLRAKGIAMPIIIMTGHGDVPLAVEAMKAGAVDFIEKPFGDDVLIDAVQSALSQLRHADQSAAEAAQIRARADGLSTREHQVLDGLLAGLPNKTIAYDLSLSPRTVEVHRAAVMAKMGAKSLSDLVRMAIVAKLLP